MLISERALYNICYQTIKEAVSSKHDLLYEDYEDKTDVAPAGYHDKTVVSPSRGTSKKMIGSVSDRPVKVPE